MIGMSEPITGEQYEIAAGPYRATVTQLGAGLRALTHDGRPLTLSYEADELPPAGCGQHLTPWPNRVDHGRYEFGGEAYRLTVTEAANDNAIHGLVRWDTWTARPQSDKVTLEHRLLGRPGYPFRLDLSIEYALSEAGLTVTHTARNTGTRTAPYGYGAHPYLTLGKPIDECQVQITAGRWLNVDERSIPREAPADVAGGAYDFRRPRLLGDMRIDNAFTDLERDGDGRAWVRLSDGDASVGLWADRAHPWLEIYTGDALGRPGIGAEPMTCPPNAFVSGTDLITLKPGEETTGSWGIAATGH